MTLTQKGVDRGIANRASKVASILEENPCSCPCSAAIGAIFERSPIIIGRFKTIGVLEIEVILGAARERDGGGEAGIVIRTERVIAKERVIAVGDVIVFALPIACASNR